MTLDEAIRKQEHWAELEEQNAASWRNDPFNRVTEAEMSSEYAAEHRQLALWLRELKRLREREPCEDAVSREAVTDVIRHSDIFSTWYEMDDTDDIVAEVIDEARKQLVDDVNELPSVTPKCPECDDVVSRRAAIDVAENAFVRGLLASPDIRKLPSVQPEPQWIPV